MLSQGSILIIDDKQEDGLPISDQLRDLCIPHLFFHADEERLVKFAEKQHAPVNKVRVIFQDINLTGSSTPSTADYSFAETVIDSLLSSDNGPWLMVTWSTWSDEEDAQYPQELFDYLRANLDEGKKPYHYVILNKSKYTASKHGPVTPTSEMAPGLKEELSANTKDIVTASPAMTAIMAWEKEIGIAVSNTLAELHSLSNMEGEHDARLGKLLYELAKAEAGKSLNEAEALTALTRILNNQLLDRVMVNSIEELDITGYADQPDLTDMDEWKRRINKMLHFNTSGQPSGPGSIYKYSSYQSSMNALNDVNPMVLPCGGIVSSKYYTLVPSTAQLAASCRKLLPQNATELHNRLDTSEYVLVDITPPCDHAQMKAEWLKFIAGFIIDLKDLSGSQRKAFNKAIQGAEFLWSSCLFSTLKDAANSEEKILILNSRSIISLPCESDIPDKLRHASITKLREQITRDLTHWLGKQMSRPGYTYM